MRSMYCILAEPNLGIEIPYVCVLSCVGLFATLCTITCQAPLSIEFPKQAYWSCLPFPISRTLPHPRIELASPVSPALTGRFFTTAPPGKMQNNLTTVYSVAKSCPTLCPPGFSVRRTFQARILEWFVVTISSSRGFSQTMFLLSPSLQADFFFFFFLPLNHLGIEEVLKCWGAYSNGYAGGCATFSSSEEQKAA